MADGIDIRLKRAANYKDSEGNIIEDIANYRLLYGEAIYLKDLNYLIIGPKGYLEFTNEKSETERIPTTGEYSGNYLADGFTKDGFTVQDLIRAKKYYTGWDKTEELINNMFGTLDSSITNSDSSKTLLTLTEEDGKLTDATWMDITIPFSRITDAKFSSLDPLMDGTASCGVATIWSREDHRHPTDTTRAAVVAPTLESQIVSGAITKYPELTHTPTNDNIHNIADVNYVDTAIRDAKETKTPTTEQTKIYACGVIEQDGSLMYSTDVYINAKTGVIMGAAWNDFAEYRKCNAEPGTVVCEVGDGSLEISHERLQKGAAIVSDTYGMIIGDESEGNAAIAIAGRVLAKIEPGDYFEAGDAVCAGPNGNIARMTSREIRKYPDRILGYVSEIPTYDEWNHVKVNNRIWIKVK